MTDANQQIMPPPRLFVGELEVFAFNDGILPSSPGVACGLDEDEAARLMGVGPEDTIYMSVNEYLVRIGGKTVLIDTGASQRKYASLGRLPANLRSSGVQPSDIDVVLLTHLHSDHMNGLVDDSGGAMFANAEIVLHEKEAAFWIDKEPVGVAAVDKNLPDVRRNLAPYRDRIRTIESGEVLKGVRAHLCPGHTPGHTGWILESGGHAAIMWGDLVHFEKIQFARPEVATRYDLDREAAAQSRRRAFEMCASDGVLILGAHLPFPGFARLERRRDSNGFGVEYLQV